MPKINIELLNSVFERYEGEALVAELTSDLARLGEQDPTKVLQAWLKNQYNRANPAVKEKLAPLARRIALELVDPHHPERVAAAFKELYPSVSYVYGQTNLNEEEFLNGEYYVYMDEANPTIVKLPRANNPEMPIVKKLNEVEAAFKALEKLIEKEQAEPGLKNLNKHANRMSALAVIEEYKKRKPKTKEDFIEFFKHIQHKYSRTGFTGEPYSEINALLAQIAWACEPGSYKEFWKILYPDITGVVDGAFNEQWPRYGEAILSEELSQGKPGAILNYRQIWKHAETAPLELIDTVKVSGFCPAHSEYWIEVVKKRTAPQENDAKEKVVFKTEFKNYYEFFDGMYAFMEANCSMHHREWSEDFGATEEGLKVMQAFTAYQAVILNAPKQLQAVFKSITGLPEVLRNVVGEKVGNTFSANISGSCFQTNSVFLKTILSKREVEKSLSSITFGPKTIVPSTQEYSVIEGHDLLLYLPEHSKNLGEVDEDTLTELIKQHEALGLDLRALVDIYRPMYDASASKATKLFNMVYQINNQSLGTRFVKILLGEPLSFNQFYMTHEDANFALKLLDQLDLMDSAKETLMEDFNLLLEEAGNVDKLCDEVRKELEGRVSESIVDKIKKIRILLKFIQRNDKTNFLRVIHPWQNEDGEIYRQFSMLANNITAKYQKLINSSEYEVAQAEILIDSLLVLYEDKDMDPDMRRYDLVNVFNNTKVPSIRSKILENLSSLELYEIFTISYDRFHLQALGVLIERQYLDTDEKLIQVMYRISQQDLTESEKLHLFEWMKIYIVCSDDLCEVLERTLRHDDVGSSKDSTIFELFYENDAIPVWSYDDYIKVGAMLSENQRIKLKNKYPHLKRPAVKHVGKDFERISKPETLAIVIQFALREEETDNDFLGFYNYFKDDLVNLVHNSDLNFRVFTPVFDEIVKKYGFENIIEIFKPVFYKFIEKNPLQITSFLSGSNYSEKITELFGDLDLEFPEFPKDYYVQNIFRRYPKFRKQIIEMTFGNVNEVNRKHIRNFIGLLTSEELESLCRKKSNIDIIIELISAYSHDVNLREVFCARLFDSIPVEFLRMNSEIIRYILETDSSFSLDKFVHSVNDMNKLSNNLDLFGEEIREKINDMLTKLNATSTNNPLYLTRTSELTESAPVQSHKGVQPKQN